jgi:hypothetical protein
VKTLLSLFDYTGEWPRPFWESGHWDVIQVDIKHGDDILAVRSCEDCLNRWGDVDGILVAAPCTDLALSGAQHWSAKDSDGRTSQAMALVRAAFRIIDLYRPTDPDYYADGGSFFWALENPVGRLPALVTLWPCVDLDEAGGWARRPFRPWYFDPCDFAGYLQPTRARLTSLARIRAKGGEGVTAAEAEFVLRSNAYTKRTGIWGDCVRPAPRPVAPVRCCRQGSPLQRCGGKSDRTKEIRSVTPAGFARAFFDVNGGTSCTSAAAALHFSDSLSKRPASATVSHDVTVPRMLTSPAR